MPVTDPAFLDASGHADYDKLNRMVRRHKSALTRAKNSGDPRKVIAAVDKAFADFDRGMWPDAWATWQIARDDAELELRMRYGNGAAMLPLEARRA